MKRPATAEYPTKGTASTSYKRGGRSCEIYNGVIYRATLGGTSWATFKAVFGRMPRSRSENDGVIDWLSTPVQKQTTTVETLLEEGADAALIHAYRKTGTLVHPGNAESLSDEELDAWYGAVNEFRGQAERGLAELYFADDRQARASRYKLSELYTNVPFTVIHLGAFLDRAWRRRDQSSIILSYGVLRLIQTIRAIKVLVDRSYSTGILALLRTCHEIWLRIRYFRLHPEEEGEFLAASLDGHPTSGRWSNRRMLLRCNDTRLVSYHDSIYPFLSGETHMGLEGIWDRLEGRSFHFDDDEGDDDLMELALVTFICLLVANELTHLPNIKVYVRRDLSFHTKQLRKSLLYLLDMFPDGDRPRNPWHGIRELARTLPAP